MFKRRRLGVLLIALLFIGIAASCARQLHLAVLSPAVRDPVATPSAQATYSWLYADATSVAFLGWTETSSGALTGVAEEVQILAAGSATFVASNLSWTGTRRGADIIISVPGATILATWSGTSLLRQQTDPETGRVVTERWVPGTLPDYNTLTQCFRSYVALGLDIAGIAFDLQTAKQFPSPAIRGQVQSYLRDAESQLATLHSQAMPHLPGLVTPWVIPSRQITSSIGAAEQFLEAPTPAGQD